MRVIASILAACAATNYGVYLYLVVNEGGSGKGIAIAVVTVLLAFALLVAALIWRREPATAVIFAFWLLVLNGVMWWIGVLWSPTTLASLVGAGVAVGLKRRAARDRTAADLTAFSRPPVRPRAVPPPPRP